MKTQMLESDADPEILNRFQKQIENSGDQLIKLSRRDWQDARAQGRSFEEFFWAALQEHQTELK